MGVRVILQTESDAGIVGFIFDADGVRGISAREALKYDDDKPCWLLVSADGPNTSPLPIFDFCKQIIVVTSPNLKSKTLLKAWEKQFKAKRFVATPPSCLDVVYLLYVKFFK